MFRRTLIISSLVLALAAGAAYAQGPRGKFRDGQNADQIIQRLQQRLNLNDAQVNGIRALAGNRRREMDSLRQEMRQKSQALRALMQQLNPNPTDVGNATLALKEVRERGRAIQERFMTGVKGLLTPEQQNALPKGGRFRGLLPRR